MATTTEKPSALNSILTSACRVRRAYIGAHVLAFEFAQKRANLRVDQLKMLGEYLVAKGEGVEITAADKFAEAKEKVTDLLPTPVSSKTIDVKLKRVVKKSKSVDLSTDITAKAKPKAKPAAKKPAKPATDKYAPYATAAMKYDADLNPLHIKKIVDHLGIALSSRDGKLMACSDPAEREIVAKSWLSKKLGVDGDMDVLDAKIGDICHVMKADRMKPRVTFYYLLAKAEGKLEDL